ncbi:hypothetical protein C0J52_21575 [Blattella germanica]|nr:hypothetical protein C0J52_21575 [Blattella germanica]
MASRKFFFIVMALCAIQVVPTSGGLVEDILNSTFTAVVNNINQIGANFIKSVESRYTDAEKLVQSLSQKANETLSSSQGLLQNLLKTFNAKVTSLVDNALEYRKNATICVEGQENYAKNITMQAGYNVYGCVQTQIQQATAVLNDLKSLNTQGLQLLGSIPGQVIACIQKGLPAGFTCLLSSTQSWASTFVTLDSSLAGDAGKLALQAVNAPVAITRCGADQVSKATSQVGDLIIQIGNCIEKVAQNS